MVVSNFKHKTSPWLYPLLGWSLVGHFIYSIVYCIIKQSPEELFWISHIASLLGGIGILKNSRMLISVSLISLFIHHLFWVFETLIWLIAGKFPFGTTYYLLNADIWLWLQVANHFYAVPVLLFVAYKKGGISKNSWIGSGVLFGILILISYYFLPPAANVNCAHALWPGLEKTVFAGLANLPSWQYLICILAINIVAINLPVYGGMRFIFRISNKY